MPEKRHHYHAQVLWTGSRGVGTRGYREYDREHEILGPAKPAIPGSSDPAFRGDATRWNPEELLVGSLSACHQLWYLHLCAEAGVVVTAYEDLAEGEMLETADGSGHFIAVTLRPSARLAAGSDVALAERLHHEAHAKCFIANSVNFEVSVEPSFQVQA